jgi:MFS family permease
MIGSDRRREPRTARVRPARIPRLLRGAAFRYLLLARTVSAIGDNFTTVALAFAVLVLTGSATDVGMVLAVRTIPLVLFLTVGGIWADRLPRRLVMASSNVVRAASQGVLALLLITGTARLWEVIVLMTLHGVASAFFAPASTAIVPETVSSQDLQQANGMLSTATNVAALAGAALGGIVVSVWGAGWAIAGDSASFVLGALLLLALRSRRGRSVSGRRRFLADLIAGWDEVTSRSWLPACIVCFGLFQFSFLAGLYVLGPVVAQRYLGGPASWAAMVTAFGLGGLLGGVVAMRFPAARLLLWSVLVLVAVVPALVLLALAAPVTVQVLCEGIAGVAVTYSTTAWSTCLQEHIPAQFLSRVVAYDYVGSMALRPLGMLALGPLAAVMGVSSALVAAAVVVAASCTIVAALPDVRGQRRPVNDAIRA